MLTWFGAAGVVLMITDLNERPMRSDAMIRIALGLTKRETDVAKRLSHGESVERIAEALDMRQSSIRQVIKAILAKTDTSGQSEHIALLARLPVLQRD